MLRDNPDLTNAEVRADLHLPSKALFSIAAARRRAGIPEPPWAAKPGRRKGSTNKPRGGRGSHRGGIAVNDPATSPAADTLDAGPIDEMAAGDAPTRRAGKAKSPLALFKPQAIEGIALWLIGQTGGRNPANAMTPQEATAVAGPAVRSADRFLAKYVKLSGPQNEYVADLAAIGLALAAWLLRIVIEGMQARQSGVPRQRPAQAAASIQRTVNTAAQAPIAAWALRNDGPPSGPDDGGGDLFAGSEPVRQGPTAGPALAGARPTSGPTGAVSVGDDFWNTVSPPELGEGGAVA